MRLNPNPPAFYFTNLGAVYFFTGQTQEAIEALKECVTRAPDFIFAHVFLTLAYVKTNRLDEARREAQEVLRIDPNFVSAEHGAVVSFKDPEVSRELT
jgi:adenylate cyclase